VLIRGSVFCAGKRHFGPARNCQEHSNNSSSSNISIKKDRNFLFLTPIQLGTTVVLEAPDTSRFARLNKGTKADGASNLGTPDIFSRSRISHD
jgi:hypothetical protein